MPAEKNGEGSDSDGGIQFIFEETEFEEESFHAASFVAKYRKVSSLESIKEQLQQYSNSLKEQLYNIINRDYKDFITIATKLDGVDTRLELVKKPLIDLRLDLSTLHDNMLASMQTIQEKARYQAQIAGKRKFLELVNLCLERIEIVEGIIRYGASQQNPKTSNKSIGEKERSVLSKREQLIRSYESRVAKSSGGLLRPSTIIEKQQELFLSATGTGPSTGRSVLYFDRQICVCSELERAAVSLNMIKKALVSLATVVIPYSSHIHQQQSATAATASAGSPRGGAVAGLSGTNSVTALLGSDAKAVALQSGLRLTLQHQKQRLLEQLLQLITSRLAALWSSVTVTVTASLESASGSPEGEMEDVSRSTTQQATPISASDSRAFCHCLRALCLLGKGDVAESLLSQAVVLPFIRSYITQGRVDGSGGRGSFSGLESTLLVVARALRDSLAPFFAAAESILEGEVSSDGISQTGTTKTATSATTATTKPPAPAASAAKSAGGDVVSGRYLQNGVDFITFSVWLPVVTLLKERFPSIFSVGIPAVFSSCFRAIQSFQRELAHLAGKEWTSVIQTRIQRSISFSFLKAKRYQSTHDTATGHGSGGGGDDAEEEASEAAVLLPEEAPFAFVRQQWQLEMYFQLRCREVFTSLDAACQVTYRGGLHAAPPSFDLILGKHPKGSEAESSGSTSISGSGGSVGSVTDNAFPQTMPIVVSLTRKAMSVISSEVLPAGSHTYNLPLTCVFAVELSVCLHPEVSLLPLAGRFFALSLKILLRLEAHIALVCNTTTPSFSKSALENLKSAAATSCSADLPSTITTATATPVKSAPTGSNISPGFATPGNRGGGGGLGGGAVTSTPHAAGASLQYNGSFSMAAVPIDELVLLVDDLFKLERWVHNVFVSKAEALFSQFSKEGEKTSSSGMSDLSRLRSVATAIVDGKIKGGRQRVWSRVTQLLSAECKRTLTAVKAIAGKYRMTNKPPPETPSQYVASILQPLRHFKERHSKIMQTLSTSFISSTPVAAASITATSTTTATATSIPAVARGIVGASDEVKWLVELLEDVTSSYCEQVKQLMETVKQMDSALQRRSKLRATGGSSGSGSSSAGGGAGGVPMKDSEKISLQISLDVEAFASEIRSFGIVEPERYIPSFAALKSTALGQSLVDDR